MSKRLKNEYEKCMKMCNNKICRNLKSRNLPELFYDVTEFCEITQFPKICKIIFVKIIFGVKN